MRNFWTALLGAVGMAVLVRGIMAMVSGIFQRQLRIVHGLGPFDGEWDADQVKFLGAILATIGSDIFTFALLLRRSS